MDVAVEGGKASKGRRGGRGLEGHLVRGVWRGPRVDDLPFGVSPHRWLGQPRTVLVLNEICP